MASPSRAARWAHYLRVFFFAVMATSAFVAAGSGLAILWKARGSDVVVLDGDWAIIKWFVLDLHVVMGIAAAVAAVLWLVARWSSRRVEASAVSPRRRFAAGLLGVLAAVWGGETVIDEHPVIMDSIRKTNYPSSYVPDQVVLTWADDTKTTQSIQWRTSLATPEGAVRYRAEGTGAWQLAEAESFMFEDIHLANDYRIMRHTARLAGLTPSTTYEYQIAYGDEEWTSAESFTTGDAAAEPFSFMYLGDAQNELRDVYYPLLEAGYRRHPDVSFLLLAGDLVNRGCDRDDWDEFFWTSRNVFDSLAFVPAIGNHDDCDPFDPRFYVAFFDLPKNGSPGRPLEETYHFTYNDAFFAVLNSNIDVAAQSPWLREVLSESDAQWKFLMWHHPAYASKPERDNPGVRSDWGSLADEFGVDIVFQGHDHGYMRTKPMYGQEVVEITQPSTVYLVSVSGGKYYEVGDEDYMAKRYENLSTYQVIDIDGGRLTYTAYDLDGKAVDTFTLEK